MSKSTPRLGKGLNALITPRAAAPFHHRAATAAEALGAPSGEAPVLRLIALDRISPNPRQPRETLNAAGIEQLATSIRESGVLQPVLVRSTGAGKFELIAGERRWRAAELAGLERIPAIIRELSDAEAFEAALIENLQREDLGPLERAAAYQQLIDTADASIDSVASRLGESRASISNYLRLLKLNADVRQMISEGELGMGQARAVAGVTSPQRQLAVARLAARRNLSVRQVEALARGPADREGPAKARAASRDAHFSELEEVLSKAVGLSVKLLPGKKKNSGRVVIRYGSLEEFDRIAEKIAGRPLME